VRRCRLALVAVLLTTALAQGPLQTFENASMGYRVDVPAGWSAQPTADHLFLSLLPPPGSPHAGRATITVGVEPSYGGTLEQGIEEFLVGLRSRMSDLRVVARAPATVSGRPAAVLELRGTLMAHDLSYRLAFLLADGRGYVVFLETLTEHLPASAGLFDEITASFLLTGAPSPTFAGVYAGGGLTLTLEPTAGGYAGTLRHGDAVYPVTARATGDGLAGAFESGGHAFEFVATMGDGTLVLATGGATYTLAPQGARVPGPVAPPSGAAVEVPHPCMLLTLLPGAAVAGPPPGIVAGTRLVYYAAAASIPGVRQVLVQNEDGLWTDPATGRSFSATPTRGAGGEGYRVLQVGHVDADVAQIGVRFYLLDGGRSMFTKEDGLVTHAGCAGDVWVHPSALASLPDMEQGGVRVLRGPYRLGERTFDAIRIHTTTGSGFVAYVYDLVSGLLIYSGSSAVGGAVLTPDGTSSAVVPGSTQLSNVWIVDVSTVDVPWRDAPAPPWLGRVRTLDYQGTYTVVMSGSPVFPLPIQERLTVGASGSDWFVVQVDSAMSGTGGMTYQDQGTMTYGRASIGGPWIAPEALGRLSEGQVIERCDVVGYATSVSAAGPASVTISEVGPMHRRDRVYDRRTGMLTASDLVQQVGLAQHVSSMRLVGGP
jgi:hypothetical protein